uniref:Cytochrome b n=1 Tax=Caulerpa ashmeadii TaxID=177078 RepID=A0A6B9VY46_9CHLO|nr:cytochrome b [Caulerpa ashmeadii]QHQ73232.1 cytochrome b [Caulerpa ashmeadii]
MRDVTNGWFLRYLHANGASVLFIAIYLHIFRGLYYGSYTSPRESLWCIGVVLLLLMIATAFIGYVLPWGQMSFWGATVITSLASALPIVGESIVSWLWGGFSVDNATLNRFFSLHYLLPFGLVALSGAHLAALHQYGSNNPIGVAGDKLMLYPYYFVKDFVGWLLFGLLLCLLVVYSPNALGHPDNYISANPMSTPAHIVPEWYFLWVYAILRSIPNKLGGVCAILLVFISLFCLPWLSSNRIRSTLFRPVFECFYWLFVADCAILSWIGAQPVEEPFIIIGQGCSLYFFFFLLLCVPLQARFERVFARWA